MRLKRKKALDFILSYGDCYSTKARAIILTGLSWIEYLATNQAVGGSTKIQEVFLEERSSPRRGEAQEVPNQSFRIFFQMYPMVGFMIN